MYRIFTSTEQLMRHPLMRKDESTDTESGPFSQVHEALSLPLVSMCAACETGTVKPYGYMHLICCQKFGCFLFLDLLGLHWLALRTVLRIRDVYPGSWFFFIPNPGSRIPDPTTATKEKGEKLFSTFFFVATNIIKLNFWTGKEKNLSQNTKNFSTLFFFKSFLLSSLLVLVFFGNDLCNFWRIRWEGAVYLMLRRVPRIRLTVCRTEHTPAVCERTASLCGCS